MSIIDGGRVSKETRVSTLTKRVVITSAQLLALSATPQELVPAPGPGRVLIFHGATVHKPAGVAYTGVAAGEDLAVKYTDAAGTELGEGETTGFLDQTTAETRYIRAFTTVSGPSSLEPVADAAMVLHLLSGEVLTGDSDLIVETFYTTIDEVP